MNIKDNYGIRFGVFYETRVTRQNWKKFDVIRVQRGGLPTNSNLEERRFDGPNLARGILEGSLSMGAFPDQFFRGERQCYIAEKRALEI